MNPINKVYTYLKSNPTCRLSYFVSALYRFVGRNKYKITKGNTINLKNCYLKGCKITVSGKGNVVDLGEGASYLTNCTIYITGSNNHIVLGQRNVFINAELWMQDKGSEISFGYHNRILGKTHVAATEGESITFGDECLFSTDVVFRTSDSHAILDVETNNRINPAEPITIGSRVWFGNKTIILKGVTIDNDSIIGTGAIVTKSVPNNCIVAGVPAKVVKTGVKWNLQKGAHS